MPDGFAGLTENFRDNSDLFQVIREPLHLRRFSAAFRAFERNERHHDDLAAKKLGCRTRHFHLVRAPHEAEIWLMTDGVAADFLPILAAAESPIGSLVVSVHDVAPITRLPVERILTDLKEAGVRVTSLLVVPDYHHRGKSVDDANFASWLRELEADGHEIVIHGYFHERPRRKSEGIREKFLTRVYTRDEAEFFDLEYEEAFARITRARDELRGARLSPIGFIAPAWLLGSKGERAARDADMQYTTRIATVIDLLTGERESSRALVYSTRSAWRRAASLGWNAALARRVAIGQLVRLCIHPSDIAFGDVWKQIIRFARRFSSTRNPKTYRDWISEERLTRNLP